MVAGFALSLLLIAAPDVDATKTLKVAYASQYEWKEDDVKSTTLSFKYEHKWERKENKTSWEGHAHAVVVDGEIVRIHAPSASDGELETIRDHLEWMLGRFVRKPFDEQFKEAVVGKPTDSAGGAIRIPIEKTAYLVKSDRIIAQEVDYGSENAPFIVRVDYETADMGGGYGLLASRTSYTRNQNPVRETRKLILRIDMQIPSPDRYDYTIESPSTGKTEFRLDFLKPKYNEKNAVDLDPAAKVLLKEAWASRFTLPVDLRMQANFKRDVDGELKKQRWVANVEGKIQIWGMEQIEVAVDEKRSRRGGGQVTETCREHIKSYYASIADVPFEEEFKGCGFTTEAHAKGTIVRVFGYRGAEAFRLNKEGVVGRLDLNAGDSWWTYKLKKTRDGKFAIDRAERRLDSFKLKLRYKYGQTKKVWVPKSFDVVASAGWRTTVYGVVTYKLSRIRVTDKTE